MNRDVVEDVVAYAKKQAYKEKINLLFDLTTNGLLINEGVIEFFKKNPEMSVIISLDGDSTTQNLNRNRRGAHIDSYENIRRYAKELITLPNLTVNMVIVPNQVLNFYKNFLHNYRLGFRRFNFLPAYFTVWTEGKLQILVEGFAALVNFLRSHADISVKNADITSDIPFFNAGFVVDCNGDLFSTNLFLSRHYEHIRHDLLKGNVLERHVHFSDIPNDATIASILRDSANLKLFYSSLRVDAILGNFVRKLANK